MALLMRQVALLSESCVVRIGAMAKRVFEPLQCEAHQCTVCRRAAKRVAARAIIDHTVVVVRLAPQHCVLLCKLWVWALAIRSAAPCACFTRCPGGLPVCAVTLGGI